MQKWESVGFAIGWLLSQCLNSFTATSPSSHDHKNDKLKRDGETSLILEEVGKMRRQKRQTCAASAELHVRRRQGKARLQSNVSMSLKSRQGYINQTQLTIQTEYDRHANGRSCERERPLVDYT